MVELSTCPQCDSVNKPDAAVCRVCGSRLRAPPPRDATPVVLERVMSGEVFAAIMGEVKRGPGSGGGKKGKEPQRKVDELESKLRELDEYRLLLLDYEQRLREREKALATAPATEVIVADANPAADKEQAERKTSLEQRERELERREADLRHRELVLTERWKALSAQTIVAGARESLEDLQRFVGSKPAPSPGGASTVVILAPPSEPRKEESAPKGSAEKERPTPSETPAAAESPRWPLFVEGFDEALGGGIPDGHLVLVTGTAGTLKSTLTYWALHHHAAKGQAALYVTLEQSADGLRKQMTSFGLGPEDRLTIFDVAYLRKRLQPGRPVDPLESFKKNVGSLVKKKGVRLVAIDSLAALHALMDLHDRRRAFQFFEWLRDLGVTTFVIAERPDVLIDGQVIVGDYDEDFLADGVLHLRLHFLSDIEVQRRIRCVKLRGVKHDTAYMTLLWDGGAFRATRSMGE